MDFTKYLVNKKMGVCLLLSGLLLFSSCGRNELPEDRRAESEAVSELFPEREITSEPFPESGMASEPVHENIEESDEASKEFSAIESTEQTETSTLQNNSMIANITGAEAENLSLLSVQEGLDIVFAYVGGEELPIIDIELRGKEENGGRLRYVWNEEIQPENDIVISEQGYLITSDNTVYRSYMYAADLYATGSPGYERSFTRTQLVNYFWVNMQTGEVIEQRWYDDSICQWELTEEYERYVLERECGLINSPDEVEEFQAAVSDRNPFTAQEILDAVYHSLNLDEGDVCNLEPLQFWNGLPGYEWSEQGKPYLIFRLVHTGYVKVSDEEMYAILELSVMLYSEEYDYTSEAMQEKDYLYYEGRQNLQFYAIDMNSGEMIERRNYSEDGQREYTQEYKERIIQKFLEE